PTGLASYAKAKGKYIGSAYDNAYISDSAYNQVVFPNVNQLTCENSMKWDSLEQTQGDFSTSLWADRVVNITILNSMTLRGGFLQEIHGARRWVTGGSWTNATLTSVMTNHITGVMNKYKGKIHTWDVVNEALNVGNRVAYLESSTKRLLGRRLPNRLIALPFLLSTITTCKSPNYLYPAETDFSSDGTGSKSTGMTNLVTRVKARGAPIEQIGIQAHLIVGSVPTTLSTNWNNFVNLGVSIAITELDIRMPTPATSANLAQQATDYGTSPRSIKRGTLTLFPVNVVTACVASTIVWGMSDAHSWVSSTFSGQGAACLYDESMQPKAAYTAVKNLLGHRLIARYTSAFSLEYLIVIGLLHENSHDERFE
ncbi:13708_t:CDS:2, partial [Acaulospora colombiana]